MSDEVIVKRLSAQWALVVHQHVTTGDISQGMAEAFERLMAHAQASGAQFAGPPFNQYPEPPGPDFTFLVCMPVLPGATAGEGVSVEELPGGEAATLLHRGPYDQVEPSWQRLMEWVAASGRQPAGPVREVYLNEPGTVPPDELLTEMIVPLA